MTRQIYLDRLEKGIKIIRTYDVMINQQQNYKTLPHYMKVFGDFVVDYLKYKTIEIDAQVHHMDEVGAVLEVCKAHAIEIPNEITTHSACIQQCKDLAYTDVAECMKIMPMTAQIIGQIMAELEH